MQITFRNAVPEDAAQAVPLIYASGPDAFNYVFDDRPKGTALDFLHYAFVREGGEFGFDNHLVVEMDGVVCGIGACYSGKRSLAFTVRVVLEIIGFYGLIRGLGVLLRGLRFERIVRPPKRSEHAVVHIAVAETLRGKGIGSRLIHQLIINSRVLPPCTFILDVSERNPRAQALYERLGFRTTAYARSALKRAIGGGIPVDVPGHYRMELTISRKARTAS